LGKRGPAVVRKGLRPGSDSRGTGTVGGTAGGLVRGGITGFVGIGPPDVLSRGPADPANQPKPGPARAFRPRSSPVFAGRHQGGRGGRCSDFSNRGTAKHCLAAGPDPRRGPDLIFFCFLFPVFFFETTCSGARYARKGELGAVGRLGSQTGRRQGVRPGAGTAVLDSSPLSRPRRRWGS